MAEEPNVSYSCHWLAGKQDCGPGGTAPDASLLVHVLGSDMVSCRVMMVIGLVSTHDCWYHDFWGPKAGAFALVGGAKAQVVLGLVLLGPSFSACRALGV